MPKFEANKDQKSQQPATSTYAQLYQNPSMVLAVLRSTTLNQASIRFAHPVTGARLKPIVIPVYSIHVSYWRAEIMKTVALYGVTLNQADIPTIKFRTNGFDPNDPGFIADKDMPFIDFTKLKLNSCITVRIPEDKYLLIQAAQNALSYPKLSNAALRAVIPAKRNRTLFLQSAADRAKSINKSFIQTTPVIEQNAPRAKK
jgi:hypothetical protein